MAYQHIFTQFRIGAPTGGGRGEAAPPLLKVKLKKNTDFIDLITAKVSHDLCYNLNHLLKMDDDQYIGILKNT